MTSLAPINATPIEGVLFDLASGRLDPLDPDYALYWDPELCPEAALPFLAHAVGLPIWEEIWSTAKKRAVISQWPQVAGKLGTEDAVRWAISVADGETVMITVPPQGFYLTASDEDDDRLWRQWMAELPEVRLVAVRENDLEVGYLGDTAFPEDMIDVGMFFADDEGTPCFFLGAPPTTERAYLIRDSVETEILFERRPDPRWKRLGEVIAFYWPGQAGAGFYLDDVDSVDGYLDGSPPIKSCATVSFVYGMEDAWPLVAPIDRVQDVTPAFGSIYDEDYIGLFCDDFWEGQFLDQIDPLRATYQSFRISETAPDWTPAASFLDFDRFSMDYHTAEIATLLPMTVAPAALVCNHSYLNDCAVMADDDFRAVDLLCRAVDTVSSHRDTILLDFEIPLGTSLGKINHFSDLKL